MKVLKMGIKFNNIVFLSKKVFCIVIVEVNCCGCWGIYFGNVFMGGLLVLGFFSLLFVMVLGFGRRGILVSVSSKMVLGYSKR